MAHRIVCAVGLLAGLASYETAQAASAIVCDAFARDFARQGSRQGQMLGGGVRGSLMGLGLGAITGGVSLAAGAAIGGGIGVVGGGARRQRDADRIYRAAFQDCMAGRIR
jgi:predicted lipid-binding transport protein (Tim44 family)